METNYSSPGHRPVAADRMRDAAEIFALRKARARYGRTARVGALRIDSWSQDNSLGEWEAFIGCPAPGGGLSGHNVRFTVRTVPIANLAPVGEPIPFR